MSIPLVQEATKDAINTSIIAIKRNIERINMLLGLSNSEEIDTSVFATKEELQALEPVNEVTVDNMQSVTSNAVAKSLSYSTDEIDTGTVWLDGKKIYKKTLVCTTSSTQNLTPDTWVTLSNYFNVSNIQSSIDSIVSNEFLPRKWYSAKANIVKNNGVLQIDVMRGTSVKVNETYLTLFYTKNT